MRRDLSLATFDHGVPQQLTVACLYATIVSDRNQRRWTGQWVAALGLLSGVSILLVYLMSSGAITPRALRDSQGHPIPLAGVLPVGHAFGGFELGMTPDAVRKAKGVPLTRSDDGWLYNALDNRHDAVLSVYFGAAGPDGSREVAAIEFNGHDRDSAPREVPYMNSETTADVVRRYGEPRKKNSAGPHSEFWWFPNGVFIHTTGDQVVGYGIYDASRLRE